MSFYFLALKCSILKVLDQPYLHPDTILYDKRVAVMYHKDHYENMPMQYTEIFEVVKNENFQ